MKPAVPLFFLILPMVLGCAPEQTLTSITVVAPEPYRGCTVTFGLETRLGELRPMSALESTHSEELRRAYGPWRPETLVGITSTLELTHIPPGSQFMLVKCSGTILQRADLSAPLSAGREFFYVIEDDFERLEPLVHDSTSNSPQNDEGSSAIRWMERDLALQRKDGRCGLPISADLSPSRSPTAIRFTLENRSNREFEVWTNSPPWDLCSSGIEILALLPSGHVVESVHPACDSASGEQRILRAGEQFSGDFELADSVPRLRSALRSGPVTILWTCSFGRSTGETCGSSGVLTLPKRVPPNSAHAADAGR